MSKISFRKRLNLFLSTWLVGIAMLCTPSVYAGTDVWVDNGDGTVTDVATGLIWERDRSSATHLGALRYCQNLVLAGNTEWRLPNVKELTGIVDYRSVSPAIDTRSFISTNNSAKFWSSTDRAGDAFAVGIVDGRVELGNKTVLRRVRCVL